MDGCTGGRKMGTGCGVDYRAMDRLKGVQQWSNKE